MFTTATEIEHIDKKFNALNSVEVNLNDILNQELKQELASDINNMW